MKLSFPHCPPAIADSLCAVLTDLNVQAFANWSGGNAVSGNAHEVFYTTPQNLVEQKSLQAAQRVGWRMTHDLGNTVIAAEVDVVLRPDNTNVTSINQGPYSAEPDRLLAAIQNMTLSESFELRVLRVPELNLMACWLHAPTSDQIIPFAPSPGGLMAGSVYSIAGIASSLSSRLQELKMMPIEEDV